ncbi:nucleoside hydrolase [Patescibacteria group bacterium]|nr:nucleoside hydrolase [Patescibacteria group bacterium]
MTKRKVIIDTDPGHDDAMAIMLAVKSSILDILALTTVCGNSTIENTTRNARYILNLLGRNDIPVYSGAEKPLKKDLVLAIVHGISGLDGIDPQNDSKLTGNASEKIIELVKNNPDEITIITLGPLTNIATAIQRNPSIMKRVKEIISMGGAIKVAGNKNRVAEFNFFVDPEAAKIVFDFSVKKTLIPLDVCNEVRLSIDDFKKIKNDVIRKDLLKMVIPFSKNTRKNEGPTGVMMYDVLAVFSFLRSETTTTNDYDIKIETKGDLTSGMSVADLRLKSEKNNNVTVVEKISKKFFRQYFINALNKR